MIGVVGTIDRVIGLVTVDDVTLTVVPALDGVELLLLAGVVLSRYSFKPSGDVIDTPQTGVSKSLSLISRPQASCRGIDK